MAPRPPKMTKPALATVLLAGLLLSPAVARAEPWIALEAGLKCAACHVNPTGGGKRTEFGAQYAARELAAEPLPVATEGGEKDGLPLWAGRVSAITPVAHPGRHGVFEGRWVPGCLVGHGLRRHRPQSDQADRSHRQGRQPSPRGHDARMTVRPIPCHR